jgi:hypothetical protein
VISGSHRRLDFSALSAGRIYAQVTMAYPRCAIPNVCCHPPGAWPHPPRLVPSISLTGCGCRAAHSTVNMFSAPPLSAVKSSAMPAEPAEPAVLESA